MENYGYQRLKDLGEGSFGLVFSARHKKSGEIVAVKQLKHKFHGSLQKFSLPEIQSQSELKHKNIVKLKQVVHHTDHTVFLVFEYMKGTLFELVQKKQTNYSETEVRDMCYQILQGLDYMHKKGYFHRDLKLGNLLVKNDAIKIGDFGSAKEFGWVAPLDKPHVTTLQYSAPEVILRTGCYGPEVDMWAIGVIMISLFKLTHPFPGVNAVDQMYKICDVIGSPTMESWPEGMIVAKYKGYEFPRIDGVGLSSWIPSASDSAVNLISSLLSWNPLKRPTSKETLKHPFFAGCNQIPRVLAWRPAEHSARIRDKNWSTTAKYSCLNSAPLIVST